LPWADLEVQITTFPSPVSLAKDAWSWLESESWPPNSKVETRAKHTDIPLAAALSFKLLAKACMAICSVAFLLKDHADQSLSSTVMDQISNKLIDKINNPITKLNKSFVATTSFLDATM
jgi:hypothetical protein